MSEPLPVPCGRPRVGLDIGGTKIHAVVLGPRLDVLAQLRVPSGWGAAEVVANAAIATRRALAAAEIDQVDLVGVGIPGAVDHRTGTVAQAVNLGLQRLDLAVLLGRELGAQVHVENDVNAAALGVAQFIRASADDDAAPDSLAYLNLGTGMAAGLVTSGRLWRGANGAAGEIGHVPIDPAGAVCGCGQRGCIETQASGTGIAAQWRAARGDAPFSVPDLPRLAKTDPVAARILEGVHGAVAAAVRMLMLSIDVDAIVVGGGVAGLGQSLFPRVQEILRGWESESPFLASLAPSRRVGVLDTTEPIAAIGAAMMGALPATPVAVYG